MSLKKIFLYRNYLLFYLLIIFLLNLFLLNLPLLNVFGYEFSVFNSVVLTFISGFYIISFAKKEFKDNFRKFNRKLFIPSMSFLIVPFLVSVFNSFFTGFCSFSDGVLFYLVITFPSVLIGYACGLTCYYLFKRFWRTLFFLSIILILLIALVEFYFNPQVYFYNPVLGYLPGTIYDEGLSVDSKLMFYRMLNVLFFAGLLKGSGHYLSGKLKPKEKYFHLYIVIIPVVFILISPSYGFSTTFGKLKAELSSSVTTEHFDIYFDDGISDDFVKLIAFHHEYYYAELADYLKTAPEEKIESFIFKDRNQKKELFGSANADVAKPWQYSIFTTYDNYNETLKHEIAHCFSAEFGEGPFKIADKINPFLIEGIASACDPFYDENDIHFLASVAYKNNYKVNIESMYEFSNFFTQASSLSYIYAGSFTKYLIDNYGIEKFKVLYTEPDFKKIYEKSINELESEYLDYLNEFETGGTENKAHYYFGRKSIFYKVCPRVIADRLKIAWGHFHNKEYEKAGEVFNFILSRAETYSAVTGLANTLAETGRTDSAISLLKSYLISFENTSYYYNLEFTLADFLAQEDISGPADSLYKILYDWNPGTTIYYLSDLRNVLVNKNLIKDYLSGSNAEKYSILKELNKKSYIYSSFPVMINLSKTLDEDYSTFVKQFDKTMFINNFLAAYGTYCLSEYMAENSDLNRARKMAALSLRYTKNLNLNHLLEENNKKMNWLYQNSGNLMHKINFNNGNE
jgi:hypothetical protein